MINPIWRSTFFYSPSCNLSESSLSVQRITTSLMFFNFITLHALLQSTKYGILLTVANLTFGIPPSAQLFLYRNYADLYHSSRQTWKGQRNKKKNCQGSKGRIFTTTNPQSVCRCVFFSTLKLPPLVFPCGFSPLRRLGKVNKARYLCWHT